MGARSGGLGFRWSDSVGDLGKGPAVHVERGCPEGGQHAVDLFAMLGGVVDGLQHDDPRFHECAIAGLDA